MVQLVAYSCGATKFNLPIKYSNKTIHNLACASQLRSNDGKKNYSHQIPWNNQINVLEKYILVLETQYCKVSRKIQVKDIRAEG